MESNVRQRISMAAANAVKSIAYWTGLHRLIFYRYNYMFKPQELAFLVSSLTETSHLGGPIFEVGCASGHTTVFLAKHLEDIGDNRRYLCVDTFEGFTEGDIADEVSRGKKAADYKYLFKIYRKSWFDRTMKNNQVERVTSIQADANTFDFGPYHDISFCLIDVDLHRPVRRVLEEVIPRMAPGGMIVVDDCMPDNIYDGALAGYTEAVEALGYPVDIRFDILGIVQIPA